MKNNMETTMILIKEIFQLASQQGIPLYGGAVRDWLLGELPRDLDFLFDLNNGRTKQKQFEKSLSAAGYHIESVYQTLYGFGKSRRLLVRKVAQQEGSEQDQQIPIKIDLTINQLSECSGHEPDNVCCCKAGGRRFDMDCNQLICRFDKTGNMTDLSFHPRFVQSLSEDSHINHSHMIDDIIDHILNKEFVILHSKCSSIKYMEGYKLKLRIQRMIKRGWKCLNPAVCYNPNCYASGIAYDHTV